jgi:hypothetical protein
MDKHSFLNLRIDRFEVQNEFVGVANKRLNSLVNRIVSPPPPSPSGAREAGSTATGKGDRQVSFKLENATVREILDKLSLAADKKIWIVTYAENATLTRTGFRRTVSFYGASPIPDAYQPIWMLLQWDIEPGISTKRY